MALHGCFGLQCRQSLCQFSPVSPTLTSTSIWQDMGAADDCRPRQRRVAVMRALKKPRCAGASLGWRGALQGVDSLRLQALTSSCHMHRMLQTASSPDDIRWLPGARLNVAESALCVRDPDVPAMIWASEEAPDVLHTLSLGELRREAMRFAAALRAAGFSPGARNMLLYVSRRRRSSSAAIMAKMLPSDAKVGPTSEEVL